MNYGKIKDDFLSAIIQKISFTRKKCDLLKPTCGQRAPKNSYPSALREFDERVIELRKKKDYDLPPYFDDIIPRIFAQALGRDLKAQKFFDDKNKIGDGAVAEEWTIANKRIKKARMLGCL